MKTITNNILNNLLHFLSETENFVFLDTSKPDTLNKRSLLFLNPVDRLQYHQGDDEVQFLNTIQKMQKKGLCLSGWLSYEFGYLLEPTLRELLNNGQDKGELLADFGVFERYYTFDHLSGESNFPFNGCSQNTFLQEEHPSTYSIDNLRASCTEDEYLSSLKKILEYIEAGDTYQVNFTLKLLFNFQGSPELFYKILRRNQSVGYGAYICWGENRIMSFSPELFFWRRHEDIMVRPMKGTLKRGKTLAEDAAYRKFLQNDIKNQSENVMIVDLLRNDLGRLMHCIRDGRVEVDSLFDVETYETLLQMTSTISGRTQHEALDKLSLYDFLKAIFPCGSVTGAPKIRTMEIINELESSRRGIYTGAIGYILADGESVFNVPIRTVVLNGLKGEMGIGSGIVHDSNPQQEWQECLLKGRFLIEPQREFKLIETMLWTPQQGYFLLDRHLKRLQNSATYFLFQCNIDKISSNLNKLADRFDDNPRKIRLVLAKDGQFNIDIASCKLPENMTLPAQSTHHGVDLPKIALSSESVDSDSVWFYHKTTNRQLYDSAYASAVKGGLVDLIFQNERGCVTEGCISNIVVYTGGQYLTPPLDDGLLAGIMREYLIETNKGKIYEKSLSVNDLHAADMLFICNSVRGVIQVSLDA